MSALESRDQIQIATGLSDTTALAWSPADGHLYAISQGVDNTPRFWPQLVSQQDDDQIADEMHRVTKGAELGWPYTYYDGVRKLRLIAPEYGGDGKERLQRVNIRLPFSPLNPGELPKSTWFSILAMSFLLSTAEAASSFSMEPATERVTMCFSYLSIARE